MRILLWDRRTGKTHECIKLMREEPDVICAVPTWQMATRYPKELQSRVISVNSRAVIGVRRMILDNVDLMKDKQLESIRGSKIVLVTATPKTWLEKMIQKHGFEAKRIPYVGIPDGR